MIYLFWFMAQIVLLVILLNFVIALISQFYEDVMNRRVTHQYIMYHELNKEYYNFHEFLVKIGYREDEKIDAIILIDGEKAGDALVWKGLTQTMKKVFTDELEGVKTTIEKKFEESKEANDNTNKQIDLVGKQVE